VVDRFNDERLRRKEQALCAAYLSLKNRELQIKEDRMNINLTNVAIEPLLSLLIGILILLVPRFLNYFVAVYLIVVGILGLMHR